MITQVKIKMPPIKRNPVKKLNKSQQKIVSYFKISARVPSEILKIVREYFDPELEIFKSKVFKIIRKNVVLFKTRYHPNIPYQIKVSTRLGVPLVDAVANAGIIPTGLVDYNPSYNWLRHLREAQVEQANTTLVASSIPGYELRCKSLRGIASTMIPYDKTDRKYFAKIVELEFELFLISMLNKFPLWFKIDKSAEVGQLIFDMILMKDVVLSTTSH